MSENKLPTATVLNIVYNVYCLFGLQDTKSLGGFNIASMMNLYIYMFRGTDQGWSRFQLTITCLRFMGGSMQTGAMEP